MVCHPAAKPGALTIMLAAASNASIDGVGKGSRNVGGFNTGKMADCERGGDAER